MTKLISIDSRDNRNISSAIALLLKKSGIAPKNFPSVVADYAAIIQEIHYMIQCGLGCIENGVKMVFCSAEQLAKKISWLSEETIRRRLNRLIEFGILVSDKLKKSRHWQIKFYGINRDRIKELAIANQMTEIAETIEIIDSTTLGNRFHNVEESDHNNTPLRSSSKKINTQGGAHQKVESRKCKVESNSLKLDGQELSSNQPTPNCELPTPLDIPPNESQHDRSKMEQKARDVEEKINTDKYFPAPRQQKQVRAIAFSLSDQGKIERSRLKNSETVTQCRDGLVAYFLKTENAYWAEQKADKALSLEYAGQQHPLVTDFLKGVAIGSCYQQEWEVSPGVIAPILISYIRAHLKGNSVEVTSKLSWELKPEKARLHWAQCKQELSRWKPKLDKALAENIPCQNLGIPGWIIETYRPEVELEGAIAVAEQLQEISTQAIESGAGEQPLFDRDRYLNNLKELGYIGGFGVNRFGEFYIKSNARNLPDPSLEDLIKKFNPEKYTN